MHQSASEEQPTETTHILRQEQTRTMTQSGSEVELEKPRTSTSSFSLSSWLKEVSIPVYVLVMFFAMSSWIDINGLWVELPLLVEVLPESWNLPSYIVILIQLANIGPLLYTLLVKRWPGKVKEWPVVYIIIIIGALSCLALIFFWDHTSVIGGVERSTGLLSFTFFLALVDCTSSVVYLPYMAILKPQYMTAFYIGEGLSGLIPGFVGLAQGVGGDPKCVNTSSIVHNVTTGENETIWNIYPVYQDPNFSVKVFFLFLFCMMLVSGLAFSYVHFAPLAKRERMDPLGIYAVAPPEKDEPVKEQVRGSYKMVDFEQPDESNSDEYKYNNKFQGEQADSSSQKLTNSHSSPSLTRGQFIYLLVLTALVNGLTNSVLPSTQSYTCLPYGGLAYTLTVRLSSIANPLACFCALFVPVPSVFAVTGLVSVGSVLAVYHLVLAALSPSPPLQDQVSGEVLVILTGVLLTVFFTFSKVSIATILRDQGGRSALIWCGAVTQIGSFIGAIITFLVVNIFELLERMPACPA